MKFTLNALIQWEVDGEHGPLIERILYCQPESETVITFDVQSKNALPIFRDLSEIENSLSSGHARLLEIDAFRDQRLLREDEIPATHRERRDKAWKTIEPLVVNTGIDIFLPEKRGSMIRAVMKETGTTEKGIYERLRRFWRRGQVKNALLPNYDVIGGRGQQKASEGSKRGRKSSLEKAQGIRLGINVTTRDKENILRVYKFYADRKKWPLTKVYDELLARYYNIGHELQADGTLKPILPTADKYLTFDQFKYWIQKLTDPVETLKRREGIGRYNLRRRAILGGSTETIVGPGSKYQIDATIGDIYLLSSRNPNRIIGRPIIYFVIDCFSRMIVGFSVALEGPSWFGMSLALASTTQDKVALCKEFGIEIDYKDWPCNQLCSSLLGDRGELISHNAEMLQSALGIQVINAPPYRADWKGIIERNFRTTNETLTKWLPGAIYERRERGDRDYRLDATLNLFQFRQLIIYSILHHNNEHRMKHYRFDEFMVTDQIEPYPLDLWNWGLENRSGALRTLNQDLVRVNLLPSGDASLTERGIYFDGLWYTSHEAHLNAEFERARQRGRTKISINYDPRTTNFIYRRSHDGRDIEICPLADRDDVYQGRDWYEILDEFELDKQSTQLARTRTNNADVALDAQFKNIIDQALANRPDSSGQSKASRIGGIRQNRSDEKEHERTQQMKQIYGNKEPTLPGDEIPQNEIDADDLPVPAPRPQRKLLDKLNKDQSDDR